MNKKVLTLCAGFMLAGSLTATAQVCETNGEFPYRSREVKSAMFDNFLKDVKAINQEYYYQLQVNTGNLKGAVANDEYVLTAERDYSTGKIYLTAQKSNEATMTHSLWKITVKDRTVNGRVYVFVNKETGYELSFDHMNALQYNGGKIAFKDAKGNKNANTGWQYANDGLMDGCTYNWAWYTTDKQANDPFTYQKVYSYFHNGTDSVMALQAVWPTATAGDLGDVVYNDAVVKGLSVDGLNGTTANNKGFAVVAVKESKENANHLISKSGSALQIKPVVAGAKVLNAAEINTMIDANGSFLDFVNTTTGKFIGNYAVWTDAKKDAKTGMSTKFTVCEPGTYKKMTFASNPFDNEFVAIESTVNDLRRISAKGDACYDDLWQTKEPINTFGADKQ